MEIKYYLTLLRRWAWLLALGLVLGALGGYLGSVYQTPIYQASTRLLVLRASQQDKSADTYLSDQQLVQTYIQLMSTRPVLDGASSRLGYKVNSSQLTVTQIRDMQAILVTVEDADPQHTADIANTLVNVLIEQNETIQTGRYLLTEQNIQSQIDQVKAQISDLNAEIENVSTETVIEQQKQVEGQIASMQAEAGQLQGEIQQLTPARTYDQQVLLAEKQARLDQVQTVLTLSQQIYTDLVVLGKPADAASDGATRLSQLQTTMQLYQEIYINLLDNLETIRLARLQNTPNVVQIEAASAPTQPVRPIPLKTTGLAAVVGLFLAGGIAFLIEYLDDTLRTPEDVERVLALPIMGYIGDIRAAREAVDGHVMKHPRSPVSEAFRSLRTNLEFAKVDRPLNKILVASSGPGEGKTTVATNLAASMAQSGRRVLLIDADLRRPRIHTIFGIPNRLGLSSLFRGNPGVRSAMQSVEGMPNLFVIPSGKLPPNPTELLASTRMDHILEEASREVDVIVVDSPPSLVADYQVLATKMDGVILVIRPGATRVDAAAAMLEHLGRVNARILGVVLNRIQSHNFYYPYKRGGYYYQKDDKALSALSVEPAEVKPSRTKRKSPPVDLPTPLAQESISPEPVMEVIPVEAEAPRVEVPAIQAVGTRPRPKLKPRARPLPAPIPASEPVEPAYFAEQRVPTVTEATEYVIGNFGLECWVVEQEAVPLENLQREQGLTLGARRRR
ncbi:MAG: polysaccharide biosynthesis tyrosine autokinase [Chloroflexi bacterium]|nr:polysaccharide biosynthesis tyrosine autokinase [Chloroflexota bacterium]